MKGSPSGGPFFCEIYYPNKVSLAIQLLYQGAFLTYRYSEQ